MKWPDLQLDTGDRITVVLHDGYITGVRIFASTIDGSPRFGWDNDRRVLATDEGVRWLRGWGDDVRAALLLVRSAA